MQRETQLVAIVNVTPDSFSDGGRAFAPHDALAAIERFCAEGADVIDIGAESTRPGATAITPEEEWARLAPILAERKRFKIRFSIDTRRAATAKQALLAGADWINDVAGFADPAMVAAVRDSDCRLVVMHSLSVPADTSIVLPISADPVQEVLAWAQARLEKLQQAGIKRERLIFDPGIGFGKTAEHSRTLLERIGEFKALGVPLLVGHSRKSFLGGGDRDKATLAVSQQLMAKGIDFLRVHDIAAHRPLAGREARHG
jgi:dihydropteroate synthase